MQFLPIEEKILEKISNDSLSEKDKIRLKYGFYLVSDAIKKGVLIYAPVIFLGLFLEVLIMHISFLTIRQVTFGWHGRTNFECIEFSIIGFIILPLIVSTVSIPSSTLILTSVFVFLALLYIGPKGTKINKLDDDEISTLRKKLLIRVLFLFTFLCINPFGLQEYILLGVIVQLIALFVQAYINRK